ncbi:type VII secretion protein EccE [Dactylosporangium sp. NPDC051485]|uniref:type VII secretion protein EccE n=1 Tax=Dactylosporangium sp. NPDC051485 TaxID=3154846 RepID=UPI0034317B38
MATRTRIVLAQAAVALVVAAWAAGPVWAMVAAPFALLALLLAAGRVRHRPLARWIGDGIRFLGRRRTVPSGVGGAGLLALVRPGAATSTLDIDGADVGVLEDTDGLVAVVRVGDLSALLGAALPALPPLSALLPTPARDVPEVRVQLLVSAVTAPSPSATPSATSYRQLTDGRVLAHQRVLVAVRVRRAGGYRRADLEESLVVAVRRVSRLLAKAGLPALPLSATSALAAVTEAAQHDPSHPIRETWTGVRVGGLHQAAFRLRRWPELGPLMGRLLTLPTSVTTLSLTAQSPVPSAAAPDRPAAPPPSGPAGPAAPGSMAPGVPVSGVVSPVHSYVPGSTVAYGPGASPAADPGHGGGSSAGAHPQADLGQRAAIPAPRRAVDDFGPFDGPAAPAGGPAVQAELVVRLAAPSAAALAQATTALRRLVESLDAKVTRLDGAQLDGLAATLPLGGGAAMEDAVLAGLVAGHEGLALGGARPATVTPPRLSAVAPPIGGEGIMLGVNRRSEPVVVRLFRPEPTRATLIGGVRCAQLVVMRALATGARVLVQSARPHAWEPFQRGLGTAEPLSVVPPGRLGDPPPATATGPQLLVLDVGPIPGRAVPVQESAWRTILYVRDDLTTADTDLLTRSDLALLQPLTPHEATLAGDALGLGDSRGWLTRISPEMLGVVINRQTVRWTQLSTTPLELQLTGGPAR